MSDEEILKKVVEKAIKNGLLLNGEKISGFDTEGYQFVLLSTIHNERTIKNTFSLSDFIFSHSFAEAFWGEGWDVFIRQMAQEKNPIKYLENFL